MNIINLACVIPISLLFHQGIAGASTSAIVEIIDPFDGVWLNEEYPDLYVRITNLGNVGFGINPTTDLVLEQQGQAATIDYGSREARIEYGMGRGDPFLGIPPRNTEKSMIIPPAHALALNGSEFKHGVLQIASWPKLMPIRAHFRIYEDVWVSSDWIHREIIPWPDFTNKELLLDSPLGPDNAFTLLAYEISIASQRWLVLRMRESSHFISRVCVIPEGIEIDAIDYDMEQRRLRIGFSGHEEDVVYDARNGVPLSGSERTVPHLHKWLSFSGRPFRDSNPDDFPRVIKMPDAELAKLTKQIENGQAQPKPVQSPVFPDDVKAVAGSRARQISIYFLILGAFVVGISIVWWWCKKTHISRGKL